MTHWKRKMVSISFSIFKEKILNDTKKQTIRKPRKYPIKVGDKLQLYWKLRTKETEFLKEAICKEITNIKLSDILFDEKIAKDDGFDNVLEMQNFFFSRYPNSYERDCGFVIIKW